MFQRKVHANIPGVTTYRLPAFSKSSPIYFHHNLSKDFCCYLIDIKLQLDFQHLSKSSRETEWFQINLGCRLTPRIFSLFVAVLLLSLKRQLQKGEDCQSLVNIDSLPQFFFCEHLDISMPVDRVYVCLLTPLFSQMPVNKFFVCSLASGGKTRPLGLEHLFVQT